MSEDGTPNGQGNGGITWSEGPGSLVDELVLTFNRGDGTLRISGKAINLEVGVDMCLRGARFFEAEIRKAAVHEVQQRIADSARVADILNRTRAARG